MFACNTLINSHLSEKIEWVLIDSTADSNIVASIFHRLKKAFMRLLRFKYHLLFSRIKCCLIFTADGLSFMEKGLMVVMAKIFRKEVILAPRSGLVINDVRDYSFMKKYISFVIKIADKVICQGDSWRKFYFDLIQKNDDKFISVQNWIDTSNYVQLAKPTDKKLRVLFLSWVDKNKGIFDLIEAVALLKDKYSNIHYDIAGNGAAMEACKQLVKKNDLDGQFTFHSWVTGPRKYELLAKANIYILPSYFEGFPNSLMEAMASKCAVVSTKVGSIADLVQHEENGLLFDAGNVEALAGCLTDLFNNADLREKMAQAAQQTVLNNNSIEFAIKRFEKILSID